MIEAPLVGLEWWTNHLLKNHETISQIDYNYIFRGNKLGYAPNRFSYPFLRTVKLLLRNKKVSFVYRTKETFLRDAFLAERDAHCVRDAASPVMHAFGACAERIASPITAQRYHLSLICKAEHFTKPKGQYFTSFSFSFFIFSICFNCTFTQHDSLPSK